MSYHIARSMSINLKKRKQTFSVASSNVFPKTYERAEVNGISERLNDSRYDILTDDEKFIYSLVHDLSGGMIQLNKSVNVKYRYAYQKMIEKRNEIFNSNPDHFVSEYGHTSPWYVMNEEVNGTDNLHNVKKVLSTFLVALNTSDKKVNQVIKFDNGYIHKVNPSSIRYSYDTGNAKKYNSLKSIELDVLMLSNRFSSYDFKTVDI